MTVPVADRPTVEVGDVIRAHGAAFRAKYGGLLSAAQRQALRDLGACRTAALGGHVAHCLDCGRDRIAYNSCRNRHCPKCQAQPCQGACGFSKLASSVRIHQNLVGKPPCCSTRFSIASFKRVRRPSWSGACSNTC